MNKLAKYFFCQAIIILVIFIIYISNFSGEDHNTVALIMLLYSFILICYTVLNIIITYIACLLTKFKYPILPFAVTPLLILLIGIIFNGSVLDALSFEGYNKLIIFAVSLFANLITYYLVRNKLKLITNE